MEQLRSSLAAAAAALFLLGAASALVGCGGDPGARLSERASSAPSTTTESSSSAPAALRAAVEPSAPAPLPRITLTMSPAPASPRAELAVTVENHSDEPWSWDCAVGRLYRWSGQEWQEWHAPGDLTWSEDTVSISQGRLTLDCAPKRFLNPGDAELRHLDLASMRRLDVDEPGGWGEDPEVLPDGHYWLGFSSWSSSDPAEAAVAGTFEIRG